MSLVIPFEPGVRWPSLAVCPPLIGRVPILLAQCAVYAADYLLRLRLLRNGISHCHIGRLFDEKPENYCIRDSTETFVPIQKIVSD